MRLEPEADLRPSQTVGRFDRERRQGGGHFFSTCGPRPKFAMQLWVVRENVKLRVTYTHYLASVLKAVFFRGILQNCEKRVLSFMSCLSVCPPAWNSWALTGRIFLKRNLVFEFFFLANLSRKLKRHWNQTRITGTLREGDFCGLTIKLANSPSCGCRGKPCRVHYEFVPAGQTVNQVYYLEVLKRLHEKLGGNDPNFLPSHGSCITTMHLLTRRCLWGSF